MKFNHYLILVLLLSNSTLALNIYPQVSANIVEIKSVGDTVKAGDILVKLDDRQARLKLQQLKIIQKIKQQNFEDAQLELKQTKELYERMVASHRDLEKAQIIFDEKKRQLDAHNISVKIQEIELEKYSIKSPIAGEVVKLPNPRNATNINQASVLMVIK